MTPTQQALIGHILTAWLQRNHRPPPEPGKPLMPGELIEAARNDHAAVVAFHREIQETVRLALVGIAGEMTAAKVIDDYRQEEVGA